MPGTAPFNLYRQWGEDDPLQRMGRFTLPKAAKAAAVEDYRKHFGTDRTGGLIHYYLVDGRGKLTAFAVDYHISALPVEIPKVEDFDAAAEDRD